MSKMSSHCSFGHLKHKLWPKERPEVKLAIWLPTTKSQESTRFPCVQVSRDIPFENSWQGIQLCFRSHRNWRSAQKVMCLQSCGSPRCGNFGTPTWESQDKKSFACGPVESCRVYYKGENGGFPQVQAVVSLVCPSCPWFVLAPKVLQLCTNHFVLVLCRSVWVIEACHFVLVPSRSSSTPLYPFIVLRARERAPTPCSSVIFNLGLTFESLKELGASQAMYLCWLCYFWNLSFLMKEFYVGIRLELHLTNVIKNCV
jgi:hypothetical protein